MSKRLSLRHGLWFAFWAVCMPALAEQSSSVFVSDRDYHISPHKPTIDEINGADTSLMPHKYGDRETTDAASPKSQRQSTPSEISNGSYHISPHRPTAKEIPENAMPIMPSQSSSVLTPQLQTQPQPQPSSEQPVGQTQPEQNQSQQQPAEQNHQREENNRHKSNDEQRHRMPPLPSSPLMRHLLPRTGMESSCINNSVTICGKSVPVPTGPLGAVVNLTAPFPYMPQNFTVQCVVEGNTAIYRIVDATQVTCDLQSCAAADVPLCGVPISVQGGVKVGSAVTVPVPPSAVSNPAMSYGLKMRVRCIEGANSSPAYRIENEDEISCNQFPCQTSNIRLCDANIEVPGGSPLGTVLALAMPPPFVPDRFVVQCLGSLGRPPIYQLIDHIEVSCDRANPPPQEPANQ